MSEQHQPPKPSEEEVLRRMLNTPPAVHAPRPKPKKTPKKPAK